MAESKFNPMEKEPPLCPCGIGAAARADVDEAKKRDRAALCHLCGMIAAEHPEWSAGQVTAAGTRKWLECALAGVRARAAGRPGVPTADAVYPGRLEWTVKDGYERLVIRELEPGPVVESLATVHPDLVIAQRARVGDAFALQLVVRGAERQVAA